MVKIVKVLLQNERGSTVVDCNATLLLEHGGAVTFVDQYRRHAVTSVQLIGEAPAAQRILVV